MTYSLMSLSKSSKHPFISLRIYKIVFYVQRRFPEKLERCVKLKEKRNAIVCKMSKVFM